MTLCEVNKENLYLGNGFPTCKREGGPVRNMIHVILSQYQKYQKYQKYHKCHTFSKYHIYHIIHPFILLFWGVNKKKKKLPFLPN